MNLVREIEKHLPKRITQTIYNHCKNYVDYYYNNNNCNMMTNGELNFLQKILGNCKIVFDVGANIGDWSKLALGVNNKIELHCFEPSKYTFRKLKDNNFPDNVICNNIGLGSKKENRILYIFDEGDGCNSLYKRKGLEYVGLETSKKEEQVQIDTIDNYCYENQIKQIDLLKVDVEGHELEVFKGGGVAC